MSLFLKKSDYARENRKTRVSIGYTTKRGVRLPTQTKSTSYEKKFLILCPTGCTSRRTNDYRLAQRKTFDTRTQTCRNCGFKKLGKEARLHGAGFKKASELPRSSQ